MHSDIERGPFNDLAFGLLISALKLFSKKQKSIKTRKQRSLKHLHNILVFRVLWTKFSQSRAQFRCNELLGQPY